VYNADGGLRGELRYVFGRLRGAAHCSLCDVTHAGLRRRPGFDAACEQLPIPLELSHRDEIDQSMTEVIGGRYPCVVIVDPDPVVLLGPEDIDACARDPDALIMRITQELAARA